jgi:phospholipase C
MLLPKWRQPIESSLRSAPRKPLRAASGKRRDFRPRLELLEDRTLLNAGLQTIKHVIIIFQENRSFDSFFGTYPGADGIPMQNGVPTVSNFDPKTGLS